jgi:hypothetical protein
VAAFDINAIVDAHQRTGEPLLNLERQWFCAIPASISMRRRGIDKADAISTGVLVSTGPAVGTRDEILSEFLTDAMRRAGGKQQTIVSRETVTSGPIASAQLRDGDWILVSIPSFGPPSAGRLTSPGGSR